LAAAAVDSDHSQGDFQSSCRHETACHREELSPILSARTLASTVLPLDAAAGKDADSESDVSTPPSDNSVPRYQSAVTYLYTPTSALAEGLWRSLTQAAISSKQASKTKGGRAALGVQALQEEEDDAASSDGEDEDEDIEICPVYSATAELPSLGSAAHSTGSCRRCCFFPKGRCTNGSDCQFCHFAHEKRNKKKNKKKNKKNKNSKAGSKKDISLQSPDQTTGSGSNDLDEAARSSASQPVSLVLQTAIPAEETNLDGPEAIAYESYECFALVPVGYCAAYSDPSRWSEY